MASDLQVVPLHNEAFLSAEDIQAAFDEAMEQAAETGSATGAAVVINFANGQSSRTYCAVRTGTYDLSLVGALELLKNRILIERELSAEEFATDLDDPDPAS